MNSYFLIYYKPSFIMGIARILDIAGTLTSCNFPKSTTEQDYLAISSDWKTVGEDMSLSIKNYKDNLYKNHE